MEWFYRHVLGRSTPQNSREILYGRAMTEPAPSPSAAYALTDSAPMRPPGELENLVADLATNLDRSEHLARSLAEQLAPVLRPASPHAVDDRASIGAASPLGAVIARLIERLHEHNDRLADLTDRTAL